jgi:uncharacterized protein (UPF0276 family)
VSPELQVGVGLRPPHYAEVLERAPELEFFEVISENFMGLQQGGGGRPVEILERIRGSRPVRLHGVSMNLGSVDPLSLDYLDRLRALADRIQPDCVSDHVCWTGQGGENLHDLLPLPWTEEALQLLTARVDLVQERLGRRLVLENPSSYLSYSHSTMAEWEFLGELAHRTGAGLLLDVNNLFVTAENLGFDPGRYLEGIPWAGVAQFHLSGHDDAGALRIDTHDRQVCPQVWTLFRQAVRRFGPLPTLVEWDEHLPDLATLLAEAQRARAILAEGVP